jgi:uncharacterized spore protein YtfJ
MAERARQQTMKEDMMDSGIEFIKQSISDQETGVELISRLFDVARPAAVFGEPVTQGEYKVITASEISVGLGYGSGSGGGMGPAPSEGEEGEESEEKSEAMGYGGGGGGGGFSGGRPVAVIEIGPNGVRVEPVVDPTKIVLAFFTAFGAMFMMLAKMKEAAGGK